MHRRCSLPLLLLFGIAGLAAVTTVAVIAPRLGGHTDKAEAQGEAALRDFTGACCIEIGAAVQPGPLQNEPIYAETLAREFSALTADNHMKWNLI